MRANDGYSDHFKRILPYNKDNKNQNEDLDVLKGHEISSCDKSTTSQFTSPGIHNVYDNLKEEITALHEEIGQSIGNLQALVMLMKFFLFYCIFKISNLVWVNLVQKF